METGAEIIELGSVDSTNSYARRLLDNGFEGTAVITATEQISGRGRQGKKFFSPASTGLYMSIILKPGYEANDFTLMTSACAVAVAQSIEAMTGLSPEIKWVNDIYINKRKVCGILCESVFDSNGLKAVIAGIGINLTTHSFPTELSDIAGSLCCDIPKRELAEEIAARLFSLCDNLSDRRFMDYYRQHSCVIGRQILFTQNGITQNGTAVAIDDGGRLIVSLSTGNQILLTGGEISLKLQ